MKRGKTYNDFQNQFNRIWHTAVEMSNAYKECKELLVNVDEVIWFQRADKMLRSTNDEHDIILNRRINKADKICTRYLENIRKLGGFSDVTPYYATGERLEAYHEWTHNQKYSIDEYAAA